MTDAPDLSAGLQTLTVTRRQRRAARRFAAVLAVALLWPLALQHELLPLRLDTVRLGGAEAPGGGGARGHTPSLASTRAQHPLASLPATPPNLPLSLLDSAPASPLVTLQALAQSDPPISPDLPAFSTPAAFAAPASFVLPPLPRGPEDGFPGGVVPTTPGGPVTTPPEVTPPVVVIPPVTPPDGPPAPPIIPPDDPPPASPPVTLVTTPPDPSAPPPPIVPLPADPAGPGGGTAGGGPPTSGVPEPGLWLEMVLGAGLAGASLRAARRSGSQLATALRARSRA